MTANHAPIARGIGEVFPSLEPEEADQLAAQLARIIALAITKEYDMGRLRLRAQGGQMSPLQEALRRHRKAKGLNQRQAAQLVKWSHSKLLRIENGTVSISTSDLGHLLRLYDVKDKNEIARLEGLAAQRRRRS